MKSEVIMGIMLTLLLTCLLTLAFNIQPIKAEPTLQPPLEMISYWKFDEGTGAIAVDSVGENNGTIYGATWTTGMVDGALSFDGVNDSVKVLDSASLDITDAITIEAWIKPKEYTLIAWIVNKNGPLMEAYALGLDSGVPHSRQVRFELLTSETTSILTWSNGRANLSQWNHIAVTVRSTNLIFYINGTQDKVIGGYNVYGVSNYDLWIGSFERAHSFFNGVIDEVAIYGRALTPGEIQQHYENGLMGKGYYVEVVGDIYVGGIYISVNKLELLAPYIGLTILLAVAVVTVGYIKKRKRHTEINS